MHHEIGMLLTYHLSRYTNIGNKGTHTANLFRSPKLNLFPKCNLHTKVISIILTAPHPIWVVLLKKFVMNEFDFIESNLIFRILTILWIWEKNNIRTPLAWHVHI